MKTIKIQPTIEVFDDPEYCCGDSELCIYIKNRFGFCELFRTPLKLSAKIKGVKCQQCKDLYKQSEKIRTAVKSCNNLIATIMRDTSKS